MQSFRFTPLALRRIRHHAALRRCAVTIARDMNCSPNTIQNICKEHGIELVTISDGAPPLTGQKRRAMFLPIEIHVDQEAMDLLKREAVRRGVRVNRLIERVAEVVATDSLFAAVLDQ